MQASACFPRVVRVLASQVGRIPGLSGPGCLVWSTLFFVFFPTCCASEVSKGVSPSTMQETGVRSYIPPPLRDSDPPLSHRPPSLPPRLAPPRVLTFLVQRSGAFLCGKGIGSSWRQRSRISETSGPAGERLSLVDWWRSG